MASHLRRFVARLPIFALLGLTVLLFAFPGTAAANTNEPIAQTGGMSATLPLLGTSLTVGVQLDPATGNISGVTLDPTGTVTATKTTDHSVKFANADGSVKVSVRAKGSRLSIVARATLDQLKGAGTWSADVFGTGAKSTVNYTVGVKDGAPTLSIDSVSPAAGITDTVSGPTARSGDKWAWAGGRITFAHAGYQKRLSIFVGVGEDGKAVLSIVLTGKDKLKLEGTLADLVAGGSRTWSAHLCDGTAVSVTYHVAADGTVVFDSSSGAPAKEKSFKSGFVVRFDGTNVGVYVGLKKLDDGNYRLMVFGNSGHCGKAGGGDDCNGRGFGHGRHHHGHGWWDAFGFGGNPWGKHG